MHSQPYKSQTTQQIISLLSKFTIQSIDPQTLLFTSISQLPDSFMVKDIIMTNQTELKQIESVLKAHLKFPKNKFMTLLDYSIIKQTSKTQSQTSIKAIYQHSKNTLDRQIEERFQNNHYFEENELWMMMGKLVSILSYLQDEGIAYGVLGLDKIHLVGGQASGNKIQKILKLLDPSATAMNPYEIVPNRIYSPQIKTLSKKYQNVESHINTLSSQIDIFKSDVYVLGLCILQAALLTNLIIQSNQEPSFNGSNDSFNPNSCSYSPMNKLEAINSKDSLRQDDDINDYQWYSVVIPFYLTEMNKRYSQQLVMFLSQTLRIEWEKRPTFKQLKESLMNKKYKVIGLSQCLADSSTQLYLQPTIHDQQVSNDQLIKIETENEIQCPDYLSDQQQFSYPQYQSFQELEKTKIEQLPHNNRNVKLTRTKTYSHANKKYQQQLIYQNQQKINNNKNYHFHHQQNQHPQNKLMKTKVNDYLSNHKQSSIYDSQVISVNSSCRSKSVNHQRQLQSQTYDGNLMAAELRQTIQMQGCSRYDNNKRQITQLTKIKNKNVTKSIKQKVINSIQNQLDQKQKIVITNVPKIPNKINFQNIRLEENNNQSSEMKLQENKQIKNSKKKLPKFSEINKKKQQQMQQYILGQCDNQKHKNIEIINFGRKNKLQQNHFQDNQQIFTNPSLLKLIKKDIASMKQHKQYLFNHNNQYKNQKDTCNQKLKENYRNNQ